MSNEKLENVDLKLEKVDFIEKMYPICNANLLFIPNDEYDDDFILPKIKTLQVDQIRFLQEKISSFFHDGSSVSTKHPVEIKQLEVIYDNEEEKYWSVNNRSLYVLKKHKIQFIRCLVWLKSWKIELFNERYSTLSGGQSIKIKLNREKKIRENLIFLQS